MPQATDELRAKWDGSDEQTAMKFLRDAGYTLTKRWTWIPPAGHEPTEDERSAAWFLITEWDFDGIEEPDDEHK